MKNLGFLLTVSLLSTFAINGYTAENISETSDNFIPVNTEPFDAATTTEWEPRITRTPVAAHHKPLVLPIENAKKIRTYFYDDFGIEPLEGKDIFENDHVFYGAASFPNNTYLTYFFIKEESTYLGKDFTYAGDFEMSQHFSHFHQQIIYKILDISGAEQPETFWQELLDSPKITKYTGCTVQQKKTAYGLIDLTSCEEDDITIIAFYNSE